MLSERLGKLHFWLFVIGFHLTFDLHARPGSARDAAADLHLRARPRLGHLEPDRHRSASFVQGVGILIFVVNLIVSLLEGKPAGRRSVGRVDARVVDDLAAAALQLRDRFRRSASRRPLWDLKHPEDPDWRYE